MRWCPIHYIWEECKVLFSERGEVRCAVLTSSVQGIYYLHSKYNQQLGALNSTPLSLANQIKKGTNPHRKRTTPALSLWLSHWMLRSQSSQPVKVLCVRCDGWCQDLTLCLSFPEHFTAVWWTSSKWWVKPCKKIFGLCFFIRAGSVIKFTLCAHSAEDCVGRGVKACKTRLT